MRQDGSGGDAPLGHRVEEMGAAPVHGQLEKAARGGEPVGPAADADHGVVAAAPMNSVGSAVCA